MLRSKYVAYSTQTDGNKDENGGILVQPGVVTETPKWAGHNVGCYKLTPKVKMITKRYSDVVLAAAAGHNLR